MSTSRIDAEGRVTLPREVIEALSLAEGDEVEFIQQGPRQFQLFLRGRSVTKLKGLFAARRNLSVVEMEEVIAASGAKSSSGDE